MYIKARKAKKKYFDILDASQFIEMSCFKMKQVFIKK